MNGSVLTRKENIDDCRLWIDRVNRIVSFVKADGFEVLQFSSREEKIVYALEMGTSGYRIQ